MSVHHKSPLDVAPAADPRPRELATVESVLADGDVFESELEAFPQESLLTFAPAEPPRPKLPSAQQERVQKVAEQRKLVVAANAAMPTEPRPRVDVAAPTRVRVWWPASLVRPAGFVAVGVLLGLGLSLAFKESAPVTPPPAETSPTVATAPSAPLPVSIPTPPVAAIAPPAVTEPAEPNSNQPTGSALDIPVEPVAGLQSLLARSARLTPAASASGQQASKGTPVAAPRTSPVDVPDDRRERLEPPRVVTRLATPSFSAPPLAHIVREHVPAEPLVIPTLVDSLLQDPEPEHEPSPNAPDVSTASPAFTTETSDDRVAIDRLLDAYKEYYGQLDAGGLATIWRSVNTEELSRGFATLSTQQLKFYRCTVAVTGDRATANCPGLLRYVPRVGAPYERTRTLTWAIAFSRTNEGWLIDGVTAR